MRFFPYIDIWLIASFILLIIKSPLLEYKTARMLLSHLATCQYDQVKKMLRAFTRNTQKLTDRNNSSATKEIIKVNNDVAQHARGNQVPPESG